MSLLLLFRPHAGAVVANIPGQMSTSIAAPTMTTSIGAATITTSIAAPTITTTIALQN